MSCMSGPVRRAGPVCHAGAPDGGRRRIVAEGVVGAVLAVVYARLLAPGAGSLRDACRRSADGGGDRAALPVGSEAKPSANSRARDRDRGSGSAPSRPPTPARDRHAPERIAPSGSCWRSPSWARGGSNPSGRQVADASGDDRRPGADVEAARAPRCTWGWFATAPAVAAKVNPTPAAHVEGRSRRARDSHTQTGEEAERSARTPSRRTSRSSGSRFAAGVPAPQVQPLPRLPAREAADQRARDATRGRGLRVAAAVGRGLRR